MVPYFEIFGQSVPSYAIMILIGYGLGFLFVLQRTKIYTLRKDDALIAYIFAGVGSFLGGKAFFMIQGIPLFIELNQTTGYTFLQYFTEAGLVYYGGFIGCILFIMLYALIFKSSFWDTLDTLLPALPLAQAFGRIGCFLVGCCYGIPCEGCGVAFTHSEIAPNNIELLPVQLIEAICVFVLFGVMLYYGRRKREPGKLFSMYLLSYGTIRFILEFFRYDEVRGHIGTLSTSQWVSIFVIALGIYLLKFYKPKQKTPKMQKL